MNEDRAKYLLVEDNKYDIEIAFFDFEEHGLKLDFHISRDGAEALEYLIDSDGNLRVTPPDAIFLDLHMPRMNGLNFLHKIKANGQTKDIRVVVFNSGISPSEQAECQRLGINDFIGKPLEYENFICTIEKSEK